MKNLKKKYLHKIQLFNWNCLFDEMELFKLNNIVSVLTFKKREVSYYLEDETAILNIKTIKVVLKINCILFIFSCNLKNKLTNRNYSIHYTLSSKDKIIEDINMLDFLIQKSMKYKKFHSNLKLAMIDN
jgi:hypothetical protein